MSQKRIDYTIGFKFDESGSKAAQNALTRITKSLKSVYDSAGKQLKIQTDPKAVTELENLRASAVAVGNALQASFNQKLNTFNITEFNNQLKQAGFSVRDLGPTFMQAGEQGKLAFMQVADAITQTQSIAKRTTGLFDKLGTTLANTVRWSLSNSLINKITGSIQEAWGYTKRLDESLNNIRIVTGKSAEEMAKFSKEANKAARSLAASTTAYTDAALIYYQQGLGEADVEARTKVTIKAANVTGQSAAEVSEQLTAVWNGYKVVAEEAELYIDKLAAVAASTAADLEELSEGMSKVASAASTMGVDIDQLSAQLSTIISVTRQDASSVGTALKTIYARLGDLKVDGVDEFGTSLGDVSGQLQTMGVNVLDQQGNLRDMGVVIEEVAGKWQTWTDAQQQAAAVAMAGKRQYNNLIALFENWDMYTSALDTSQNAEGTLEEQQKTYEESIKAILQKYDTARERFKGALFDVDSVESVVDALTDVTDALSWMVEGLGGLKNMLPLVLGSLTKLGPVNGFLTKAFYDLGTGVKNFGTNIKNSFSIGKNYDEVRKQLEGINGNYAVALQRRQELAEQHRKGIITDEEYAELKSYNDELIRTSKAEQEAVVNRAHANDYAETTGKAGNGGVEDVLKFANLQKQKGIDLEKLTTEELRSQNVIFDEMLSKIEAKKKEQKDVINEIKNEQAGYEKVLAIKEKIAETEKKIREANQKRQDIEKTFENFDFSATEEKVKKAGLTDKDLISYSNLLDKKPQSLTDEEATQLQGYQEKTQSDTDIEFLARMKAQQAELNDTIVKTTQELVKQKNALAEEEKAWIKYTPKVSEVNKELTKTKAALEKLKKNKNLTGDQQKQIAALEEKCEELEVTLKENSNTEATITDKTMSNLLKIRNGIDKLDTEMEEAGKNAKGAAEDAARGIDDVGEAQEKSNKALKEANDSYKDFQGMNLVSKYTGLASSAMMAYGSVSSLVDAFAALGDENVSTSEKVSNFIMSSLSLISTLLPTVIGAIATIRTAHQTATSAMSTQAQIEGAKAQMAFGWISVVLTAITAVAAVVIGIFSNMKKGESEVDQASKKVDEAKERAKEAQEELKKVRQEYTTLLDAIEDYQSAKTALDGLREGTEEWEKAVQELNMQVLDLCAQYPVLLDYMKSENGVLSISQEGFDQVIEKRQQEIKDAAAATTFTNIAVKASQKDYIEAEQKRDGINSTAETDAVKHILKSYQADNSYLASAQNNIDFQALADRYWKAAETSQYYIQGQRVESSGEILREQVDVRDLGIDKDLMLAITAGSVDGFSSITAQYESSEKLAKALEENYEGLEENIAKLDENAQATRDLESVYLRQLAEKEGIADSETYANMALTAEDLGLGYDEMIATAGDQYWNKYLDSHAGSDQTNDDDKLDNSVKQSIKDVYGEDAVITGMNDVDWSKVESIESFKDIEFEVNGQAMTGADLVAKHGEAYVEEKLLGANKELETQINTYAKEGIDTRAAYFMQGDHFKYDQATTDKANFSMADLQGLSKVITDEAVKANINAYKTSFETRRGEVMKGLEGLTSLTGSEVGFANFTLDDFNTLQNNMLKAQAAGGGDAVASLYEKYATDAEALELINTQMAAVNWNDTASIGTFITKLAEQGIVIDESNVAWNNFMDDVYDGTKQWINNSQQVIDNLATIKELTGDIQVGDILSEEDYKRLLAISPEIANMFIRTADGYKSLANSKDLDKTLKKQYQSLSDLKSFYTDIQDELSASNIKGSLSTDFNKSGDVISYMSNFASKENIGKYDSIFDYAGTSREAIAAAYEYVNTEGVDTSSTEYQEYLNLLKSTANKINQAALDNENGLLNSRQGQEIWVTELAKSWSEVEANKDNLDTDVYNKAEEMWKNTYLTELGFSGATSFNLGATELESHLENIRKLELDYYQDIEGKLAVLEDQIENTFGASKLALLKEQSSLQEENLQRANEQARATKNSFDSIMAGFLSGAYETYGVSGTELVDKNGELDLVKLRDLQSTYAPDSAEYEDIENLISMWSSVDDAAAAASEAAWALVDAEIEAFKYQAEIQNQLNETAKQWMEFGSKFKDYEIGDLDVFGKESAADLINNAFEDYAAGGGSLKNWFGQLDQMGGIMVNYNDNIDAYNEAATATATANQEYITAQKDLLNKQDNYAKLQEQLDAANEAKREVQSALDAKNNAEKNREAQKKEMEAAQKEYETASTAYENAAKAKQSADDTLSKANNAVAEAQKAKDEAQKNQYEAQQKKDSSSKDERDAANEALAKAKDGLDKANAALKNAQTAQTNAQAAQAAAEAAQNQASTVKQNAAAKADKETAEYEETLRASQDADAKATEALKNYANALGVEYKSGMTMEDLNAELAKLNTSVTEAEKTVEGAQKDYKDAQSSLTTAQDAQRKLAESIAKDNPYATVGEDGSLIWNEAAFDEDWQDYLSEAQDTLEGMQEQLQSLYDGYLQAQDELMAIYDTEIEKLSKINSILTTSADLWKIVGKNADNYSSKLSGYYQSVAVNSERSYQLANVQLQIAQEEYKKVMDLGDQASQEMIDKVSSNLSTATENVLSTAQEWMTAISTQFSETLNATINDFVKSAAGLDLAGITEEWEHAKVQDERYIDEVNAEYSISSLERTFQKSIDATDSVTAQNKLNKAMQEQLKLLREKDKLTQYDLDRANAMYELELKKIALEEAQQTANKMKLTRDANGNYSYQYVADEDSIAKAEEELAAAENNLYNMDKERNQTLVDDYYATMSEANAAIAEAMEAGDLERVERLKQYYFDEKGGLLAGIQAELATAQSNLNQIGSQITNSDTWASSLADFTEDIVNSDLGELANNINTLLNGKDGEGGMLSSFNDVADTIEDLLTEDSVLDKSLGLISDSLKGADEIAAETEELMIATHNVLTQLPSLTQEIDMLAKKLEGYGQKYQEWMEQQTGVDAAISKNTLALEASTEASKAMTKAIYEAMGEEVPDSLTQDNP